MKASKEFTSTLSSTYSVASSGNTHVVQVFDLKNNFSTIYATQYALEVSSNNIANITVTSNGQTLTPSVTTHASQTTISFSFPDKVVGKDQVREFTVSYDTPDISIITGSVVETHVPRLANTDAFDTYSVSVVVDAKYGPPAIATPNTYTLTSENGHETITFTNVGQKDGISVLFGKQQTARAILTYHLENPDSTKGVMEVALPPDTDYQRVSYESISPLPLNIRQDTDGNWIARYGLEAGQRLTVTAVADFTLYLIPKNIHSASEQSPGPAYLASQLYWPIDDPSIRALAQKLKTPQAIFDYVVKTLKYNYSRLEGTTQRLGALQALQDPSNSICTEFTDLFITLSRAAGIPAREINGYAYTQNNTLRPLSLVHDVLHAWPQYWDAKTLQWISVDPTWANTTGGIDYFNHLDFSHISFVIHGESSQYPYAAGLYKFSGQDTKDVSVEFGALLTSQQNQFSVHILSSARSLLTTFSPYFLLIKNESLHAVHDVPYIYTLSSVGQPQTSFQGDINLPPLSEEQIPVQLPGSTLFSGRSVTIQTSIDNQIVTNTINVQSFLFTHYQLIVLALFMGACAFLTASVTWRLLVPRRKRSSSLRR